VVPNPLDAAAIAQVIPFSSYRELSRTLGYTIPALALIWYLILEKKSLPYAEDHIKPNLRDIYPFLIGFPCLVLIGLGVSFLMSKVSPIPLPPKVEGPVNVPGWIAMAFSCLGTGYLEESYFRYYLLTKLEETVSPRWIRVFVSVAFFALCHVYEGPWGILNALLAGTLLAVLYERYKSLHGIALAHGGYNAFVYCMGSFF
jgi:membrane protease YdiL (CAAX protease family)